MQQADSLQRFLIEKANVRGVIVRLDKALATILNQHNYPEMVNQFLGQSLAVAAMLSSTLKYQGQLTLQMQTRGALKMLVAKCNDRLQLRGLAQFTPGYKQEELEQTLMDGNILVTVDPDDRVKPYQSIVSLSGGSLTQAFSSYLQQSEQLPTSLTILSGAKTCIAVMLQHIPDSDDSSHQVDDFAKDVLPLEIMAGMSNADYLKLTFPEVDIRLFDDEPVSFACNCSRERSAASIRLLGEQDAKAAIVDKQVLDVHCEYCNTTYSFDREAIHELFAEH
jgi:molecular chaperone Hsp33